MIVVTLRGAPSPLLGRTKGLVVVQAETSSPSSALALTQAMSRHKGETDGFLFVAPGARIRSAALWPVVGSPLLDVAAHVESVGTVPAKPGPFGGVGRLSLDTLVFRPTANAKRVLLRWTERNALAPDREAQNLAIALVEIREVAFLHLAPSWCWREDTMRALHRDVEAVVEFECGKASDRQMSIGELTASLQRMKLGIDKPRPPEVAWVGHLYQYTGYGKANREILFRIANTVNVWLDDSHREPCRISRDIKVRLDAHKSVLIGPRAPLLRLMGPDYISTRERHRIVWTMQETSGRVHPDMVEKANRNFDELWTPSEWNLNVFKDSGVQIPMRVVPLGVNPLIYKPLPRRPLPLCRLISTSRRGLVASPKGFNFITIGLPGFRKGWDVVADAMQTAFDAKSGVNFVIGLTHSPPGWNEKIYRQFAQYKVPIWTLEGAFDEFELAQIYSSANCYVSASRGEGFNLPAAESAACGIPIIVPLNTAHPDVFGPLANYFRGDGERAYPEGDWISDWYKGQLFTHFGKKSIRALAEILENVKRHGQNVLSDAALVSERIRNKFTWDAAASTVALRLLEVQPR